MPYFNEGQEVLLKILHHDISGITRFWVRLFNDTVVKTDTLADLLGEPATSGYEPQKLERSEADWPSIALDSGDMMATGDTVTFVATGSGWGPVNTAVVCVTDGAAWQASTAYSLGNYVQPATPNGLHYECTTAGTSAGTEPTWPTTPGTTVNDGTAVWTCKRAKALFWDELSQSRTVYAGETLDVTPKNKQI